MYLFAQARPNQDIPPEFIVGFIIAVAAICIVALIVQVFFLLTLSRCLSRIAPPNRQMEPGMVWLNLIPLFNIVWIFIIITRLADSLRNEFEDRRLRGDDDFGKSVGLAYAITGIVAAIPYCGAIFGIVSFVCFIIYWVKISGYSAKLLDPGDYADDDDDR